MKCLNRRQFAFFNQIFEMNWLSLKMQIKQKVREKHKIFKPAILTWDNVDYRLGKVDFYHKTKSGTTTLHHFSLSDRDEGVYFKLTFNGRTLNWTLNEYQMAGNREVNYSA